MVLKAGLILRTQAAGRKGRQWGPEASSSSVHCLSLQPPVRSLLLGLCGTSHSGGSKHNDDMRLGGSLGTALASHWSSQREDKRLSLHRAPPTLPTPAPPSSRRDKHWEREGKVRVGQIQIDKDWAPGRNCQTRPPQQTKHKATMAQKHNFQHSIQIKPYNFIIKVVMLKDRWLLSYSANYIFIKWILIQGKPIYVLFNTIDSLSVPTNTAPCPKPKPSPINLISNGALNPL